MVLRRWSRVGPTCSIFRPLIVFLSNGSGGLSALIARRGGVVLFGEFMAALGSS